MQEEQGTVTRVTKVDARSKVEGRVHALTLLTLGTSLDFFLFVYYRDPECLSI